MSARALRALEKRVITCARCPELRAYCARIAREKRRSFAGQEYWGKPVPGFGDPSARIWILGLAPAAHGGNRTGRVFTGDRSGDFLFAALFRAGLASQPTSVARGDGLALSDTWVSASLRCAPPANKPKPQELDNCAVHLDDEWDALERARVILCLGGIAWDSALRLFARKGIAISRPRPKFAHDAEVALGTRVLMGCYHVSQQNTFTGRLTPMMIDRRLERAVELTRSSVTRSRRTQ